MAILSLKFLNLTSKNQYDHIFGMKAVIFICFDIPSVAKTFTKNVAQTGRWSEKRDSQRI